jgi:multidrug resistance protein EbrB
MLMSFLELAISVIANSFSSVCIKISGGGNGWRGLALLGLGLGLGTLNVICYAQALKRIRLNVAYPLLSGGSLVLIALLSFWLFRERLSPRAIAGLALTLTGMVVLALR